MTHHDARCQTRLVPNSFKKNPKDTGQKIGINADRKPKIAKIKDEGQAWLISSLRSEEFDYNLYLYPKNWQPKPGNNIPWPAEPSIKSERKLIIRVDTLFKAK